MIKKITIFISLIILISGLVFLYLFYINKETTSPINSKQSNDAPFGKEGFVQENKEVSIDTKNTDIKNIATGEEVAVPLKIKSNINSWRENQDPELLEEALLLVLKHSNNESFYEPWGDFIKNNPSTLTKIIDQDSDPELILSYFFIYEWFIVLSGEYETLTPEKKQEVSRDFMQIQIYMDKR